MNTVLHLIETGGPGGAETVYLNIVRGLGAPRWRHVPVLPTKEWMYDQLLESGVEPYLIAESRVLDLRFFARLVRLIREQKVDLIHAHLFGSGVHAALLSKLCSIPALVTLHGGMDLKTAERFFRLKVAIANSGLKKIVFVSEPLRKFALAAVPLRRDLATVIPNGIDAARFLTSSGAEFRREFGIGQDEFIVGAVATPGRAAKGLDILLEVAANLKARAPGIRFVIVGDTELGRGVALLHQRAALGLTYDVVVTGFRDDVHSALAAFDVYALTSRSEGFSLSLIEAMASGLPVVATRCGGPEQIINDGVTGILVENGSVDAITTAIEQLRSNPERRRTLGEAARASVIERFQLQSQLDAYERLYEECLGEDSAPEARADAVAVEPRDS